MHVSRTFTDVPVLEVYSVNTGTADLSQVVLDDTNSVNIHYNTLHFMSNHVFDGKT